MSIDYQALANRIREIREQRNLTQEQLAAYAGISSHYLGNLEQGVRRPSLITLMRLCGALGTTPNDLFCDSITDKMLTGVCEPIENDSYALRDSARELFDIFGGYLPLYDEETPSLFGIPLDQIQGFSDPKKPVSLSELLMQREESTTDS